MRYGALQLTDRLRLGVDRVVYRAFAETHHGAVIEPDIVMIVGPQARLTVSGIDIADPNTIGVQAGAGRHQRLYLGKELRRHQFVGVEIEHPVITRHVFAVAFLRAISRPGVENDACAQGFRDSNRIVGRAAVDDDGLVDQSLNRANTVADPVGFVFHNNAAA